MSTHRRLINKLEKLNAELTPVEPRRIEVRRKTDGELLYTVGEGEAHQLTAVESQIPYLRWLSSRLDLSAERQELLLGDRSSGTSWAGLTAIVSLSVANAVNACVFTNPNLFADMHRLLRDILPSEWVDREAEKRGFYRLPKRKKLYIVSYKKPDTWPENCEAVLLNDHAFASEETIEAIMRQGTVRIVAGNPPLESKPSRAWVLRERDRALAAGTLFRFDMRKNQSLHGPGGRHDQFMGIMEPESAPAKFWDGTGL